MAINARSRIIRVQPNILPLAISFLPGHSLFAKWLYPSFLAILFAHPILNPIMAFLYKAIIVTKANVALIIAPLIIKIISPPCSSSIGFDEPIHPVAQRSSIGSFLFGLA